MKLVRIVAGKTTVGLRRQLVNEPLSLPPEDVAPPVAVEVAFRVLLQADLDAARLDATNDQTSRSEIIDGNRAAIERYG